MATIAELKRIRRQEALKLKVENSKLRKARALDDEKAKIVKDIKRIRAARMRDQIERRKKANRELEKIKSGAKKASRKVIDFLYRIRGY